MPTPKTHRLDLSPIAGLSLPLSSPICWPCAEESGGVMREGHMATAWEDACAVCGETRGVVAVSDWCWPAQTKSQPQPLIRTNTEDKGGQVTL